MMRCLGCGAEIAERAQVCARCGSWAPAEYQLYVAEDRAAEAACDTPGGPAPSAIGASVGQQSPESAPDPDVDGAVLAEWVETRRFSRTRRRPGYDEEEVDAFLDAIRDSFLGVREPSLTPDEIRVMQFSTTRLRPGYDEEEVDAFLDEAESRLAAQVAQSGEQPQDKLAGQPQIGELELDADSLPIQNRPATSRAYLTATACLVGSLVSVGLAAAEIAEYARHNRVDNVAILGLVIGGLAGSAAVVNDNDKRLGWAHRINTVAAWLGFIGFFSLLFLYGGQHGLGDGS
jgi:DivIVA domain-containing protein